MFLLSKTECGALCTRLSFEATGKWEGSLNSVGVSDPSSADRREDDLAVGSKTTVEDLAVGRCNAKNYACTNTGQDLAVGSKTTEEDPTLRKTQGPVGGLNPRTRRGSAIQVNSHVRMT